MSDTKDPQQKSILERALEGVREDVSLKDYTTYRIGGPATYFYEAKSTEDAVVAVAAAKEAGLPHCILGGGANVLVSDGGFGGLVVRMASNELRFEGGKVYAEAGVNLTRLATGSVKADLTGLEWLAGIPGTVGGAIRGNAGAWGSEIRNTLLSVRILRDGKIYERSNEDCHFGYRESIFKHNDEIILDAVFSLRPGIRSESETRVKKYLVEKTQTQAVEHPSSGCVFKNVEWENLDKETLEKIESYLTPTMREKKIISAGLLIDEAGCKGMKIGGALVSEKHANFIVNTGGATAEAIVELISAVKQRVRARFGIQLELEIQLIGI